jgi:hypothetical protein
MSVQRVAEEAKEPQIWASEGGLCFACGNQLSAGELVVAWSANDKTGVHHWHEECAVKWAAAFMRDVWEIGHAMRGLFSAQRDKYSEPDWTARA